MRALMKLGPNLIAAYCPNTPVDRESFAFAIHTIRDGPEIPLPVLQANGFVHAADVQGIKADGNAHSFRLAHLDDKWHVFSSFFGGRIGAYVRIPGPNRENWRCADIVAPLKSKDWTVRYSPILPHMRVRVELNDATVLMPSFKLQNSISSVWPRNEE